MTISSTENCYAYSYPMLTLQYGTAIFTPSDSLGILLQKMGLHNSNYLRTTIKRHHSFCLTAHGASYTTKAALPTKGKTKMETAKTIWKKKRHAGALSRGTFVVAWAMLTTCTPILFAQAQDNWPEPSVALYDCNTSAASGADSSQQAALNSASKLIFQDIVSDSSTREVFLISLGFADTTSSDFSSVAGYFTLPDTSVPTDFDFAIGSKITGSGGSYALTDSIENGQTFAHAADGIATIGSATSDNVKAACSSAVQQILPLETKIQSYEETLKATNPLLTINPQIEVSPNVLKLPLNGSTGVNITATDCDGAPIANRLFSLDASLGSLSTSSVKTDGNGKASVNYTAGSSKGVAIITATLQNLMSVTRDTISPSGSASILTGDIDTTNLWVLEFDLHRSGAGYIDQVDQDLLYMGQSYGSSWQQSTSFYVQSAHGKFIGSPNGKQNTEFDFTDTTLSISGIFFTHNFSKSTYSDATGQNCPHDPWDMSGSSQSYVAKVDSTHQGSASFSYSTDPNGLFAFNLAVPCTMVDEYAYDWDLEGTWDNGDCKTNQDNQSSHSGSKLDLTAGITYYGIGAVPGLTIIPSYADSVITGYTIIVNYATTFYGSDGSFNLYMDECTATLKPFSSITAVRSVEPPKGFFLAQNYPNPFNPSAVISYYLPVNSFVTLKVYDVLGREVETLVNKNEAAGYKSVTFDGSKLSSGVYFYRLEAGAYHDTKKLLLLK